MFSYAVNIRDTDYPAVRHVLDDGHLGMSDEQIEEVLLEVFPDPSPEEVENFMRSLQRIGRRALPVVRNLIPVAQSVLPALGPYGMLASAGLGVVNQLLPPQRQRSGQPQRPQQQRPTRHPATPRATPPSRPTPRPLVPTQRAPTAPGTTAPAAAQLVSLLSQPQVMQSLLAMVMGQRGRTSASAGGRRIPQHAIANALSEYAQALADALEHEGTPEHDTYYFDEQRSPRCDLANPAERAQLLFDDLVRESMANELTI
ncbi:MAG: hypothetical protein AAF465_09960 [Pseudomonadota bacterium]